MAQTQHRFNDSGYTFAELMVVVGIIGVLATIAVPQYIKFANNARSQRAIAEMAGIGKMIEGRRFSTNKTLIQITGSFCTACNRQGCPWNTFNWEPKVACTAWNGASAMLTWKELGFETAPVDPWGEPYLIDENEMEFGVTDCRKDWILSTGFRKLMSQYGGFYMLHYAVSLFVPRNCPHATDQFLSVNTSGN